MELFAHTFSGVLFAIMMEEKSWQPFAYSAYRRIQSQYLLDNGNRVLQLVQQVWIPLDQTRCLLQILPNTSSYSCRTLRRASGCSERAYAT